MLLRRRVTGLFALALLALGLLAGLALALRESRMRDRQNEMLVETQRLLWEVETTPLQSRLQQQLGELAASPAWQLAAITGDENTLARLATAASGAASTQVDIYDAARALRFSSSNALTVAPLVDAGTLERLGAASSTFATGLRVLDRDHAVSVVAQRQRDGGVLAIGADVGPRLRALTTALKAESWLVSPRARVLAFGGAEPLALTEAVRLAPLGVSQREAGGARWQLVSVPLPGLDGREAARLVSARNAAEIEAIDRLDAVVLAAAGASGVALLLLAVTLTLRRTLEPLGRTVAVVDGLAAGNLAPLLGDGDRELRDEAGRLARAVERLRGELLSLGTLREERSRVSRQQERLIREQLRALAATLDDSERSEVLSRLDAGELREGEPPLARLADVLGRLTGMVGSQQARLLELLRELRAALETQALFVSLQQELEIARHMQRAILPREAPRTTQASLAARMIPAREVGGDFYDWFLIDPRQLALVVADVSGKGVPAAFFMAIARTLLKSNAPLLLEPAVVVARLNAQLCEDNEQTMFVTLFYAVLDLQTGVLRHVNAGHNPPLVIRRGGGRTGGTQWLARGTNPALAVIDDVVYRDASITLQPGDELLLYTDGITEATDAQGRLFGEAALKAVFDEAASPAADGEASIERVVQAVRGFEAGAPQADDITCVWLRYEGPR